MLTPKELVQLNKTNELLESLKNERQAIESNKVAASIKLGILSQLQNNRSFPVFNGAKASAYTPMVEYGSTEYDFILVPAALEVAEWLKKYGYKTDVRWLAVKDNNKIKNSRAIIEFWVENEE